MNQSKDWFEIIASNKYTNTEQESLALHLASISETDTLFMEKFSNMVLDKLLLRKNAGCFGGTSDTVSLVIMKTTSDMEGLSIGLSCTHRRPMWMHLKTSFNG